MLVHRMPRLMTGPLAFLAHQRGVLDLANRRLWLKQQITELRQRNYTPWHRGMPGTASASASAVGAGPGTGAPALGNAAGFSVLGPPGIREHANISYGITTPLPFSTWGDTTRICVVRDRTFRDAVRLLLRTPLRLLQQVSE